MRILLLACHESSIGDFMRFDAAEKEEFERTAVVHAGSLLRVAKRLLGNPSAAEDAVQETLLAGWRTFDRFQRFTNTAPSAPDSKWSELLGSMHAMHVAMSSLQPTGDNDADFIRLMLLHHQAAIYMAKTQLSYGQDPQMRRLAQEIITDQQSEIDLMQLWLRQHEPKLKTANR